LNKSFTGDCRDVMRQLIEQGIKVQMCVTSPPYWGLRNYGVEGQLGLEETPEGYVANMVEVFRLVRELLAEDGVLWLILGDSYAAGMKGGNNKAHPGDKSYTNKGGLNIPLQKCNHSLKPKDLIGIPWLTAKALQAPYYLGKIKSERDRIYLTATIDAEGTICGFTHKRKDNGEIRRGIHITVTNSNLLMLDECYRIWPTSKKDHNAHGIGHFGKLDTWRWIAHDVEEKSNLLAELYPYFICKKKQALLAWNFLEISKQARGRNKGEEGKSNQEKCAWIVNSLSKLNHLESIDIPDWIKEPPSMYEPGWYLRQDIIWHKPNPMPESVKDRCTKSHEYIFLLSKKQKYYYDYKAILEPANYDGRKDTMMKGSDKYKNGFVPNQPEQSFHARGNERWQRVPRKNDDTDHAGNGTNAKEHSGCSMNNPEYAMMRNKRSVWTVNTQPYKEAHFATFPPDLIKPCILAGSRPVDIVLDPFFGSGTTGEVCEALGRQWLGIDLNPQYQELQNKRTAQMGLRVI